MGGVSHQSALGTGPAQSADPHVASWSLGFGQCKPLTGGPRPCPPHQGRTVAPGCRAARDSDILPAMESRAFHYAFLVRDLDETRRFYVDVLGCREGRSAPTWIDFELFGNQLSCHLGTARARTVRSRR